ncbi:MAG: VTT domain-containing protein [Candidatus Krumholzibacteria bacterium]|nr:VTT domain-containing protein [Candidatus Krumholzibacteria bacterium]
MDALQSYQQRHTVRQVVMPVIRAPFFWQLATLVTMSVASKVWLGSQADPGSAICASGIVAPFVVVLLQGSTAMTPVGSSVIPILNGMLFPLLLAVFLNLCGALLGGVGLYYVWRRGQHDFHICERIQSLPPWARRFARTDLRSLIVMRALPCVGCNVANFIAGSHRVPLPVHILSIVIGALPGSIIYASLGAGIIAL